MAFHFHWPLGEILDLEHPLRRSFASQIESITSARMTSATAQAGR